MCVRVREKAQNYSKNAQLFSYKWEVCVDEDLKI